MRKGMEPYEYKKKPRNNAQSNVRSSKSYESIAKSVTLSREFIDTFTKIIFCEK
jgi:hypothetical protein